MPIQQQSEPSGDANVFCCDLLVAGSGAAGLAAALTAVETGLSVLVVEKDATFGGTSALSGGGLWIPGNRYSREKGQGDTPEKALTYLRSLCGNTLDVELAETYLAKCVEAVDFLEAHSEARFGPNPIPDYRSELDGGLAGGRSLRAARFDGRRLGPMLDRLKPPLSTATIFGGMMISAEDLPDLFKAGRSLKSAIRVAGMLARHFRDKLANGRVTRLANGNALVAAIATSLFDRKVPFWLRSPIVQLLQDDGKVVGAIVLKDGREIEVRASRGVILATGGFPQGKRALYPHRLAGIEHFSLAPASNTGDGLDLAETVSAVIRDDVSEPAALSPVSVVRTGDAAVGFPHFFDRSKPGFIAVTAGGRRFGNETDEYHVFGRTMINASTDGGKIYLICDHKALRRYGVGVVPPFPGRLSPWIRKGYLTRSNTVAGLAASLGMPKDVLEQTISRYNQDARHGADTEFSRGATIYNRFIGDAEHSPSPSNAPLDTAPFYAVRLLPGDLGTFSGVKVNRHAQAVTRDGSPIEGLYVVGNDMASFMGGAYPAAGITLGPGITFGRIAALHAAG